MENLDHLYDVLLISFGATLGANSRFVIYKKFERKNINKNKIILLINTLSCFLFGLFCSYLLLIKNLKFSYQIGLFFSIGFLGSLSTFSSFISNLFDLFIQKKFYSGFNFLFISLALGIFAFLLGWLIGS